MTLIFAMLRKNQMQFLGIDFNIYNPYKNKDEFFISSFIIDIKNNKLLI